MAADSNKSSPILFKNRSWSPAVRHDIEWEMLKINQRRRRRLRRSMSLDADTDVDVTDDDVKELKASFELGFGFDLKNDLDPKLVSAFPALELYADVNRQFNLSRSSSIESNCSSNSDASSNLIVDSNDDPQKVKMRLKLWALVVACSIREASVKSATEITE